MKVPYHHLLVTNCHSGFETNNESCYTVIYTHTLFTVGATVTATLVLYSYKIT